jgi:quercetin dioxygenase-like cupin family protein
MSTKVQDKLSQLVNAVEGMRQVVFSELVDWESLNAITVGETVLIGNTSNKKLHDGEHSIIFRTVIPAGEFFPFHWHDFLEQNLMLVGELQCDKNIYKKGDWMKFEPFKSHTVKNKSEQEAIIIVIFTK